MKIIFLALFLSLAATASFEQSISVTRREESGLVVSYNGVEQLTGGTGTLNGEKPLPVSFKIIDGVALLQLATSGQFIEGTQFAGISFNNPLRYKTGVCLWRYKPWNSWTKPMRAEQASKMPKDDVQFFYYQTADSIYAAVVPLNGNGFRTTLGNFEDKWGSRSQSYSTSNNIDSIPSIAIAFGKDPYELFEKIYRVSLEYMGKADNQRTAKQLPEIFNYLGWCTWNASDNGKKLNKDLLLKAAQSFAERKVPVGWFLVDDGWFNQNDGRLQSYEPNAARFPNGFKPVIDELKSQYKIRHVGVWHAFNGLWHGIDTASALGRHFKNVLFSYKELPKPNGSGIDEKKYYFIQPGTDSLRAFYNNWYEYLKGEGFDFVKVDNQRIAEDMAAGNYPIFTLSDSIHKALNAAVMKYFNGAIINCMDMTAEAYFNFGATAVARSVEDYFPYTPGENYNLNRGNAAAHVLQALYNSIYFSQMVFPDFDLFQSHNPNAVFHAIARALNCAPIYITDNIGEQNAAVLIPLVFSDGRTIHSETPLLPTKDCLFQLQDARLFKGFSMVRNTGLLGVWNAADTSEVKGFVKADDVHGIQGNDFILYEYFSKSLRRVTRRHAFDVKLPRLGYRLYYVIPVQKDFAAIGLINKYNAPATILDESRDNGSVNIRLYEGGPFAAYSVNKPKRILINGKETKNFTYKNKMLAVTVPALKQPSITFVF